MFFRVFFLSTSVMFGLAAHAEPSPLLRIHGSNTVGAALMPALVESWLHDQGYDQITKKELAEDEWLMSATRTGGGHLDVELHTHGSSTGFADLQADKTDMAMASRPIKADEVKALARFGRMDSERNEYVIALDGVAVIVNPANPLREISKDNLRRIFAGEISNWSALGLPAGAIRVHARDDKSGTFDTFASLVLDKNSPLTRNANRYESNAALSAAVAADPQAIGFTGFAYVRGNKSVAVADDGAQSLAPQPFNVSIEDYVLSRRLFLYIPSVADNPLARELAEYAVSPAAQKLVTQSGFISQEIFSVPLPVAGSAPDEYKALVQGAQRLSLNIRFRPGYITLDNKAIRDLGRLVSFMEKPENKQRKLMLFGFADTKEEIPYLSLTLSVNRADAVADILLDRGLEPVKVRGYGQAIPVASNKSDRGRHQNRRVELWVQ